jgi:hypothetical protein
VKTLVRLCLDGGGALRHYRFRGVVVELRYLLVSLGGQVHILSYDAGGRCLDGLLSYTCDLLSSLFVRWQDRHSMARSKRAATLSGDNLVDVVVTCPVI